MTGAALIALALVTVLVLGTYLVQAAILAIQVGLVLAAAAGHVLLTLLCGLLWCGWFLAQPRRAWAELRAAIARAEAESAIRRLNGAV